MTSNLRILGLLASFLPLACSDDGVPAEETSGGSSGTGTGSTSDITGTTQSTTLGTTAGDTTTGTATAGTATAASTGEDTTTDSATGGVGSSGSGDTTDGGSSGSSSSGSSSGASESSSGGGGTLEVGEECSVDGECISGVCWDFNHYDGLCFGTACSGECSNDDDCVALMTDAGAPYPEGSSCGPDGRCSVVGTGFGAFACASRPSAPAGVTR